MTLRLLPGILSFPPLSPGISQFPPTLALFRDTKKSLGTTYTFKIFRRAASVALELMIPLLSAHALPNATQFSEFFLGCLQVNAKLFLHLSECQHTIKDG